MFIKDIYPTKAQFRIGEKIGIAAEFEGNISSERLICNVYKLHNNILSTDKFIISSENKIIFEFIIDADDIFMSGYGVEIELYENNNKMQALYTAFDILGSWKYAPRYGFLSDFSPNDLDDKEDLKEMNKYHLNVVQYYDWMYRHDDLIPKLDVFTDPLQRELSFSTVKNKIASAQEYGMEAMAYGAVYASSPEFYEQHKDMAIYKNNGEVFGFSGFLYMMDISRDNKWHDHIIGEFYKAVQLGFDGIHMDQYGYPKEAICIAEGQRKVRCLREDFPDLINDTKEYIEGKGEQISLIFNAVNNWPVETVARSKEDAVYIEVWPPNDTYQDLYNLIANAKKYAPQKQVILAAYIKPFLQELNIPENQGENAALLTMASIFAGGGFHLLLGEKDGVLTDPYYPKYRSIKSGQFIRKIRNYYDFIVKYEELIYDLDILDTTLVNTGGINEDYTFNGVKTSPKAKADSVWTLIKEKSGYKIINMVNFTEIENMNWNEPKENPPLTVRNLEISVLTCYQAKGIYVASPDSNKGRALKLDFEYADGDQGRMIKFLVPELINWNLIYIVY